MPALLAHLDGVDYTCGDDPLCESSDASETIRSTFAVKTHLAAGTLNLAYCNLPTQHAFYTRRIFPTTCAWCDETSADEMASDADLRQLRSQLDVKVRTRKCDPICKHCAFTRNMPLPLVRGKGMAIMHAHAGSESKSESASEAESEGDEPVTDNTDNDEADEEGDEDTAADDEATVADDEATTTDDEETTADDETTVEDTAEDTEAPVVTSSKDSF